MKTLYRGKRAVFLAFLIVFMLSSCTWGRKAEEENTVQNTVEESLTVSSGQEEAVTALPDTPPERGEGPEVEADMVKEDPTDSVDTARGPAAPEQQESQAQTETADYGNSQNSPENNRVGSSAGLDLYEGEEVPF